MINLPRLQQSLQACSFFATSALFLRSGVGSDRAWVTTIGKD
jgi:hypothetical protein